MADLATTPDDPYTRVIRDQAARATATDLIALTERSLLAYDLFSKALQERYPADYEAWNAFGENESEG